MKKKIVLVCLFILSIFIFLYKHYSPQKSIVIAPNYTSENRYSGMGLNYEIMDITKGKYKVSVYSKEFKEGKLVNQKNIYNSTLTFNKKLNKFNLSVYQESENINVYIEDYTTSLDFDNTTSGIALFGLEENKEVIINNELPFIGYIVGDKVKNIQSSDIDKIFNYKSDKEILIYLKINRVN
ncbi:hypothetical protein [Intestinibacter sp.]